jgi:hypothetical protein
MGGSFEDISENAEPEILKEKANLLLDIIASMPDEDKTLENFPPWLHMLTPRGQGPEMDAGGPAIASVVRTVQRHVSDESAKLKRELGAGAAADRAATKAR